MIAAVVTGVLVVIGLVGTILPVLPGLLLVWAATAGWGLYTGSVLGYTVTAVVTALALGGAVLQYAVPGRRLKQAGLPLLTTVLGLVGAVAGFVFIPVLGLPLGFVLGIYLGQVVHLGGAAEAWPSTRTALGAVAVGMAVEAGAAFLIALTWVVALVAHLLTA